MTPVITRRSGQPEDFSLLQAIHRAAMRASVERVLPWDDAAQEARLRKHFAPTGLQVILADGAPIGTFCLTDPDGPEGPRRLEQFYLLPAWQARGIGGHLLAEVLGETDRAGRPVTLSVLKGSDARRLYERHGFVQVGEDAWQDHLARQPRPASSST